MRNSMRVSATIIKDNNLLLIHRVKADRDYFVLPGGSPEGEETLEAAIVREVKEETGFDGMVREKLEEIYDEVNKKMNHLFRVEIVGGELCLGGSCYSFSHI